MKHALLVSGKEHNISSKFQVVAPLKSNHLMCINKPFKSSCQSKWAQYLQERISQQKEGEHIKTASKQQVYVQSNEDLNSKEALVQKSLVCGISNALDGSENDLVRCAKELDQLKVAYGLEEEEDLENASDDLGTGDPFEVEMTARAVVTVISMSEFIHAWNDLHLQQVNILSSSQSYSSQHQHAYSYKFPNVPEAANKL